MDSNENISREDWKDWRHNKVTKAFYGACTTRIEDAKDNLAASAGQDSTADSFLRGFIYAYREMQDFRYSDEDLEVSE